MWNYLNQLYETFQKLATWQKVSIGVAAALIFLGMIGASYLYSSAEYTLLFRNLDLEESANIKEKLDEGGYVYKLAENGTTIYVSSSQKETILLTLAKDNVLPDRNKGYAEIFGTTPNAFSNSRKIEDLNILRGLQAELETTVKKSSKLISSVRLHIFYAPERTFKEDQKQDKATVYLVLKAGRALDDGQITGIRNLIANATGVPDENISIIDQNFIDLSKKLRTGKHDEVIATDQFELQRKFVGEMETKLQDMLNKVLGIGMSVVSVYADLNFDKKESFDTILEPPIKGEEGGIVISEEATRETFKGSGKKPVGVPGTQSNIPTYPEAKNAQDEYDRSEGKKNYDTNKKQVKTVFSIGDVKKLSISVVVDDIITKDQLAKIENTIVSAAGIDKKRGDTIVVEKFPFNREQSKRQEEDSQKQRLEEMLFQLLLISIPTIAIFGVLWFVWRNKELIITYFRPITVKKEAETLEEAMPSEARERIHRIEVIKEFIERSPKDAANLLQIWLSAE